MFYVRYALSELRRRSGRTVLTALGLAVGVALVVVVNALSSGLSTAQRHVLQPLTGVGTDMTVTRPLVLSANGGNPFARLTPAERAELQRENGGTRVGFRNIAKPGQKFSIDRFRISSQLSYPASAVSTISRLAHVQSVSGSLTLNDTRISGTMPKTVAQPPQSGNGFGTQGSGQGGFQGGFGGGRPPSGQGTGGRSSFFGPSGINFVNTTVTGVDPSHPGLAAVTPGQITSGKYLPKNGGAYDAVLSTGYARTQNLQVGSTFKLSGKTFHVIGLASSPLGGTASDAYVRLATLQTIAGFKGRINGLNVRADSGGNVTLVKNEITHSFSGAQVTTASDLASRVGGSLGDAKKLSNTLGIVLEVVGLLAAVLITILLTLSSVAKRTREIGTLKAIGWSQSLVVRQISLESLAQGLVGGLVGAALGAAAAAAVGVLNFNLTASVAQPQTSFGPFGFGRFGGGSSAITAGSTLVHITAPVNISLIAIAVVLAAAAGLVAGGVGGMRAARLRPASALRTVE